MLVLILESVPLGVRGELTRWLIEPHPGVFIGRVSARVREHLWEKCCATCRDGGVLLAWSTNTEQRFQMRLHGNTRREIVEYEGVQLIRLPKEGSQKTGKAAV